MNNKFKKTIAVIIAVCFCISTGVLSVGALSQADQLNGQTADHVYLQNGAGDVVTFDNTENFFGNYGYNEKINSNDIVVPGYSTTKTANIENKSDKKLFLYMMGVEPAGTKFNDYKAKNPDITGDKSLSTLQSESDSLMKDIKVKVEYTPAFDDADRGYQNGVKKTIYEGDMTGKPVSGGTGDMSKTGTDNAVCLGLYKKNDKGTLTITVSLDPLLDNHVAGKVAMIDWVFQAMEVEDASSPSEPPPPATGEASIPYTVAAICCALSAAALFFVAFRQKRRSKEEA